MINTLCFSFTFYPISCNYYTLLNENGEIFPWCFCSGNLWQNQSLDPSTRPGATLGLSRVQSALHLQRAKTLFFKASDALITGVCAAALVGAFLITARFGACVIWIQLLQIQISNLASSVSVGTPLREATNKRSIYFLLPLLPSHCLACSLARL